MTIYTIMKPSPFSKLNKELSLSEKIEQQIIDAIHQKIFLPGDKILGEMELAQNFGVSRTAVREALHRLAGRGVVEIRKNSGVYVASDQYSPVTDSFYHLLEMKCGDSSLQHIATVRLIIEPEVARMAAANAGREDISRIRELYSNMESNINNPPKMIGYDIDFHRSLVHAARNPILPVIMEPLFQMMTKFISDTYEYPQSPLLALKSHLKLVGCLEAKDEQGALEAMKTHLTEARDHASVVSRKQENTNTL